MHEPTIIAGGQIRTMCAGEDPPAVLVQGGRIAALGTPAKCRAQASGTPHVIDCDGRTLMPGFVDAHAHLLMLGSTLEWADLTGCRSIDDLVQEMARFAAVRPGAHELVGFGYDQSKLAERRHPTARDLDRADATRPLHVQHASGHGYVANTAALRLHGIDRDTVTPAGGRIDRDEHGDPTGLVFDAACDLLTGVDGVKIANHGPNFHMPITDEDADRMLDAGQERMLAAGITSICDAQVTSRELRAYLRARDDGRLKLRVQMLMLSHTLEHLSALGMSSRLGDERLEIHGVKLYADGSVIARTAYLPRQDACCGVPAPEGYLYHEPQELQRLIGAAHELGLIAATHAQGSLPIELVLDAVEDARAKRPRPQLVHRIEHCGFPTSEQVERMARLAVVPVPQPAQIHLYGESLEQDFGGLGASFYPYGAFKRAGLPVIISSDAPVTEPNPLHAAWAAVTRETLGGGTVGSNDLRVDRVTALRGMTTTPGRLLGRSLVGTLQVGAHADLVFVDGDPFSGDVACLPRLRATETWVGGRRVWVDGADGR